MFYKNQALSVQIQSMRHYRTGLLPQVTRKRFNLHDTCRTLEETWALKDVNLEIRRGEAVGIMGTII